MECRATLSEKLSACCPSTTSERSRQRASGTKNSTGCWPPSPLPSALLRALSRYQACSEVFFDSSRKKALRPKSPRVGGPARMLGAR